MTDEPVFLAAHVAKLVEAIQGSLAAMAAGQDTIVDVQAIDHPLIVEIHAACTVKPEGPSPLVTLAEAIVVLLNQVIKTQAQHSEAHAAVIRNTGGLDPRERAE